MYFSKMHGAGNDYVIVDGRSTRKDWGALARAICDRHHGVGSDGLLVVERSDVADARMHMFNPDGSEAEMCGNGIRCFARYVLERDIAVSGEGGLSVETLAGVKKVVPILSDGHITRARVAMGEPRFRAEDVPVAPTTATMAAQNGNLWQVTIQIEEKALSLACVSMGNPHAVAFVSEPVVDFPLERLGPLVERHRLFPNRVNFEVVHVQDREHVEARVWERGVGETLACGTGACAIGVVSRLTGYTGDALDVHLPGGVLTVTWGGRGPVYLEGPVAHVFDGDWPD